MSLFNDDKFNRFDDLTQMISPYVTKANALLSEIPDVVEVPSSLLYDNVLESRGGGNDCWRNRSTIDANEVIDCLYKDVIQLVDTTIIDKYTFLKAFRFAKFDDKTITISSLAKSEIKLNIVKYKSSFSESDIVDAMCIHCMNFTHRRYLRHKDAAPLIVKRCMEIVDIFNIKDETGKLAWCSRLEPALCTLENFFVSVVRDRTLMIRDAELLKAFIHWVRTFVLTGDDGSLKNTLLIAVMSSDNQPIYSVSGISEEV